MSCTSGTTATSTTQPMATYRAVDHPGFLSRLKNLTPTPSAARPHTTPNNDQPQAPRNGPSTKGV